jgi:ABC-type lipoprotein release transport system permease subunit
VEPTDPITFVGTALVLGATAVFASFLPAWRAGRTDPLRTVRSE